MAAGSLHSDAATLCDARAVARDGNLRRAFSTHGTGSLNRQEDAISTHADRAAARADIAPRTTGKTRNNNFDALRLAAASSVVFSHAFLIGEGSDRNEPILILTGHQSILGLLGVFVFFAMSGYLVTQSWFAHPAAAGFAWRRALRIFPALWVNLLVVGLVLGPMVTTLPLGEYATSLQLGAFFANNLLLSSIDTPLPGVSFSEWSAVVNGSLWTLRYEAMMYAMVMLLGLLRLLRLSTSLLLVAIGVVAVYHEKSLDGDIGEWAWLVGYFASGMVMFFLRDSRWMDGRLAVGAAVGLVAITYAGHLIALFPIFGGYLAIFLATSYWPPMQCLSAVGDLSYGIYIYGWPVEQALRWATGGRLAWWELFASALAISAALAFSSWHLIEKHALRLKRAV